MAVKKVHQIDSAELRHLAEEQLGENRGTACPPSTEEEPLKLLHELQMHQIELEMQNAELRQARDERDKMEARLGKYSDLYDFAPVGYFNLDNGGIIRAVNLTGTRFLGVERSLLIGRRLDLFISDETRPVFRDFLDKVFASESKETCEIAFLEKKHSPLFVQVTAVVSESREECRAVVIDITERHLAEQMLRRAKEEWERSFACLPDLIAILDNQHRVLRVNNAMAMRLGLNPEECLGLPCYEAVHGLSEPPRFCPHSRTIEDGLEHTVEVNEERLGGDFIVTTTPLLDEKGESVGAIHIARDITERKRAEERIEHLASFPQLNPNPILELDSSGKITFFNPATVKILETLGMDKADMADFIPSNMDGILESWDRLSEATFYREVAIKEKVFGENIFLAPQSNVARIYTFDITERKRAEEALRDSEHRERERAEELATVLDAVPTPVFVAHNQECLHLTGNCAADELLHNPRGAEASLSAPADVRPRHFRAIKDGRELTLDELPAQRAARGIRVKDFEFSIVFDDGTTRHVLGYGTPLHDDGGQPRGAVNVLVDITERKRTEEKLRETSAYLDNLIGYANAPIIVWDPHFRITRFNRAFETLTGRKAEDVLGHSLEILFPRDQVETSMQIIRKTMSGERWEDVEINILHVNGSTHIVLWNSATIFATDGITPVATIAQGYDITGRKRTEETLRETNEYLDNLIGYANAPIIVWDPQFRITRFNRAFETLTGREAEDVIGQSLEVLFPGDQVETSMELIRKTMGGERWEDVEINILHVNGSIHIVLWNSATIFVTDGITPVATIAQGHDITERKQSEEALRDYARRLIEMEEELRKKLAAELHDEIGPDLTSLGINYSIINDNLSEESRIRLGARIEDSGRLIEGVSRTIRNIMSKLRPPVLDDYGLPATLRWYADIFSKRNGIAVSVRTEDPFPSFAIEIEMTLFRIAQEALTNVAKYADALNVAINLGSGGGIVRLTVIDDGKGFAPGSVSTPHDGSGWGLTIMRERAELFGGTFRLDSEPGKGTVVSVEIRESL